MMPSSGFGIVARLRPGLHRPSAVRTPVNTAHDDVHTVEPDDDRIASATLEISKSATGMER
jgi:hypothetical protein